MDERMGEKIMYRMARVNEDDSGMHMAPERRHDMEDGGMLHEDPSAISNLPQSVKIASYAKTGPYLGQNIDDTIRGIDHDIDENDRMIKKQFAPRK